MMPTNPNQTKTEQTIADGNSNSHGANEIPNTSPSKIECQYQTQQPYYGWNLRRTTPHQRTNIVIMILIFIVTGTYACFSYLQWNVLNKSMQLDQRAWMGVDKISGIFKIGQPLDITIFFKNTGKTPAKNVTIATALEPVDRGKLPNFTLEQTQKRYNRGLIAPTQSAHITNNATNGGPLTDFDYRIITDGDTVIYVHGILEYDDIFKCHHWLTYCCYFSANMKEYYAYTEHNDTGDNQPPS